MVKKADPLKAASGRTQPAASSVAAARLAAENDLMRRLRAGEKISTAEIRRVMLGPGADTLYPRPVLEPRPKKSPPDSFVKGGHIDFSGDDLLSEVERRLRARKVSLEDGASWQEIDEKEREIRAEAAGVHLGSAWPKIRRAENRQERDALARALHRAKSTPLPELRKEWRARQQRLAQLDQFLGLSSKSDRLKP